MPRLIALEWDAAEARIAVARVSKGHVDLDHALAVPLPAGEGRSATEIGAKVKLALQACGGGGDALVAVGRSSIELRFLTVPPVPPEELPDLVRFQAARQFSQPIEEGLIDFSPLQSSGDPPTSVLAAAITPETLKTIRDTCEAAGLTLKHLVLRPFAADSLLMDRLTPDSCVLTIDRLAEEVDLTVVLGEQAVFPRTVRVASYGTLEEQAASIVGEIRRTMAAAQNQLAGHKVSSVAIFGRSDEQQILADSIRRDLSLSIEFVDPLRCVTPSDSITRATLTSTSRFAPLVGMLVNESRARRHEIDFLSPRRRPVQPDRKRLYTGLATAAASIALLCGGWLYWQLSSLESQIEDVQKQSQALDAMLKKSRPKLEQAKALDEYAAEQVTWLAELREISMELPKADRVILRSAVADVAKGGPTIVLQGAAKESSDIPVLEASLRDERHRVSGSGGDQVDDKAYPWSFAEKITLIPAGQGAKTSPSAKTNSARRSP